MPVGARDCAGGGSNGRTASAADRSAYDRAGHRASAGAALACLALGAQESLPDRAAIDEAAARLG